MMMSALKMTALRIADSGECRCMMLSAASGPVRALRRVDAGEHRGQNREILGHVVRETERRQRAARHDELLADLDDRP